MEKIAVSACLLGVPCRYDGRAKPNDAVKAYVADKQVVRVCPEVMGGLRIPHPAHEIVAGHNEQGTEGLRVEDAEGNDGTAAFIAGARRACEAAVKAGCSQAILKAKSPSCGVGQVYDGTFTGTLVPGYGVAARLMRAQGIRLHTEKDFEEERPGRPLE